MADMKQFEAGILQVLNANRPMTAHEIAKIIGVDHSPDAIKRLRKRKRLKVTIVGETRRPGIRAEKLYLVTPRSEGEDGL